MTISLYDITVPVFTRSLTNLASLLKKAESQAALKGYPAALLLQSRLYPDMYELSKQVIRATNLAIESVERFSETKVPPFPSENIINIEQHINYVTHAINYLLSVAPRQFSNNENQKFSIPPEFTERYSAVGYSLFYLLPNFYFHVTTAYNILRHNGIEIGKRDYIGHESSPQHAGFLL